MRAAETPPNITNGAEDMEQDWTRETESESEYDETPQNTEEELEEEVVEVNDNVDKASAEEKCKKLEELLLQAKLELERKEKRLKTLEGKITMRHKPVKDYIRWLREIIQEPGKKEEGNGWRIVEELDQNLSGFLLPEPDFKLFAVAGVKEEGIIPMVTLVWSTEEVTMENLKLLTVRNLMNV
ncbi:unnamed protein product [Oikopleura dioica]|uniref:Uncharacterized protein n=1 Tax=Oikopleura dioica TaxID=34765 RepID=E4Y1T5_OIKDI|nr:unnamed protein product [Oikopleura dioica]